MNRHQRRAGNKKQGGSLPPSAPPPVLEALLLQASRLHQAGKPADAVPLYQQVLQLDPRHAETLYRFGIAAHQMGRAEAALHLIGRAVEEDDRHPGYAVDLGNILLELGRSAEAAASFRRAVQLQPALAIAHFNLGNALKAEGRLDQALAAYGQAASLQPDYAEAHNNQGLAAQALGRLESAETAFAMALLNRPTYAEAHANLGVVQLDRGRVPQAMGCFRRALALQPGLAEAHNGLGNALKRRGRLDEAEQCLGRAVTMRPAYAEAHHNLGQTRRELGRPRDALAAYQQALGLVPDLAEAHFAQGLALLQLGAWPEGWRKYEFRWAQPSEPGIRLRQFPQPIWSGDAPRGRTLLLWSEQGFGDTIQFFRFAHEMTRRGWKVVLEVQRELARLFSAIPGIVIVAAGEAMPAFDVHFPLLSLPERLNLTTDAVPQGPSLWLPSEAVQRWRRRLAGSDGLAVGLVWRGSPTHKRDRWRSMEPGLLSGLLDHKGIAAVSLQKDARPEELAALAPAGSLLDAGPELGDFADTAALIAALDLVISVDSAVLHLASALAVPCWGLIDHAGDWRWLAGRRDSPWYPSLRLFRQPARGDWEGVIAQIRVELADLVNRRAAG